MSSSTSGVSDDPDAPCFSCNQLVNSLDQALECDICCSWYHKTCSGVSVPYYELINDCEGFPWICKSYKDSIRGSFSSMDQIRNENLAVREQASELFKELMVLKSESSNSLSDSQSIDDSSQGQSATIASISSPPAFSSSPSPPSLSLPHHPHHPATRVQSATNVRSTSPTAPHDSPLANLLAPSSSSSHPSPHRLLPLHQRRISRLLSLIFLKFATFAEWVETVRSISSNPPSQMQKLMSVNALLIKLYRNHNLSGS